MIFRKLHNFTGILKDSCTSSIDKRISVKHVQKQRVNTSKLMKWIDIRHMYVKRFNMLFRGFNHGNQKITPHTEYLISLRSA